MGYVWTSEQVERYRRTYQDLETHHTGTYATFATTEEFVRSVLPPCLVPTAQPAVTIHFGAFMEWVAGVANRHGRDRAALIGVSARYGNLEGTYYLTVVEEEEVNISTGREAWGMPKKQGAVDFYEDGSEFFGFAERKGYRLLEVQGTLGAPQEVASSDEPTSEFYFELRGYPGANMQGMSGAQLVIFECPSRTTRTQPLTDVRVKLGTSPFDTGVETIPLGDRIDGAHIGGTTRYIVRDVVELDGDGHDYAPYLLGRLYDDWPDLRELDGRVVGAPATTAAT